MPLYDELETRPVRLEPSYQEVDMATLLRDAALAGGLGGAVGGGAGRAMIPYEGLPATGASAASAASAATGATVRTPDGYSFTKVGPNSWVDNVDPSLRDLVMTDSGIDAHLAPDPSLRSTIEKHWSPEGFGDSSVPREGWAQGQGSERMARKTRTRLFPPEGVSPPPEWADPEVMRRDLRANLFPPPDAPGLLITNDPEVLRNRFTNEAFQSGANRAPQPGRLARMGAGAGRFAKAALSPVNIAADLLLGSAVGAGSAGAGYASAAPESAGLFTPPGEGYEGLVRAEDIERVIAQKELEKEAERQRLLEQYRASGYDLDPNTRLRDLR